MDLKVISITSKSATLQWSPPESNGGQEITGEVQITFSFLFFSESRSWLLSVMFVIAGYIIEKQRLKTKWLKVVTLEPSVQQFCVENLKEKSEYYFKVYAENTVGLSDPAHTDLVSLETHSSKLH